MQLHYALLCTEGLPSIYGLTLIKPQSIGLNRWDLYWLNTLKTKINWFVGNESIVASTCPYQNNETIFFWATLVQSGRQTWLFLDDCYSFILQKIEVVFVGVVCRSLNLLPLRFPSRKLWNKKKRKLCNDQVSWQDWFGSWCRKHSPSYPDLNFQFVCSAEQSTKSKNHV